ncbi:helix-turn-helix domain-containing protein [Bacillus sp. 1P06AnD]|uniref:helix-turn-helix domain-containing protein n=1 Tax=Bacillus sp. 1P06AnD TaxID=3132208 RepID=UPI00399FE5CE
MDDIQKAVARNLRSIRLARHLSLDQLSQLTSVSKAMLSQIEKGQSNPTVTTLWKIANGLQVSFSTFLKEDDRPNTSLVELDTLEPAMDDEAHYLVYSIFPFDQEKRFELFTVDIHPGFTHHAQSHSGIEYIMVRQGELTVTVGSESFTVTPNKVLQFSSASPHSYKNECEGITSFYNLIYYPVD